MLRLLFISCCLLVAVSANTDDNKLLSLLKKFLAEEDKRASTGACSGSANSIGDTCNGGDCNDYEDPWGLGFYCTNCPGNTGGYQCEVKDPCSTNPCPGKNDQCYGPVSMDPLGRYCWASRHADMAARLQRKVDDGEMKPSELESLVRYMGSSDFDESLEALKRVLE